MKTNKKTKSAINIVVIILALTLSSYSIPIKNQKVKETEFELPVEIEKDSDIRLLDWNEERIELEYNVPELNVEEIKTPTSDLYHQLSMSDSGNLEQSGQPLIPFRTLKILLPYGKDMETIQVIGEGKQTLEGNYRIEPAQEQNPIGLTSESTFTLDNSIYDSIEPFPEETYSVVGVYNLKGYKILVLNLFPVSYIPKRNEISYYEKMKVLVHLNDNNEANFLLRGKKDDENHVAELVNNPQLINTYSGRISSSNKIEPALALPQGSYDYLIITNEALKNSNGAYTFQDLANSKIAKGIQTNIVTVEYIYNNYEGIDNQEKIRNFIIDAYSTWGINYVLLGGDGDGENLGGESEDPIIPTRGLYASFAQGSGTDYNIPSDLYYAGLHGTWDDDRDGLWGEPGEDDLYAEVYIGRAPVDSEEELSNFVMKTLLHEAADGVEYEDPYLFEALMVGEFLGWFKTGGDYKDEIKEGSDMHGYQTVGIPELYNVMTLYDRDSEWNESELIDLMNEGVHIINHLGHANWEIDMKLHTDEVDTLLTNDKYFFAYSQGCYAGAFDNRNTTHGYRDNDCIVEHFVTNSHGAFAFIANSRYGWGHRDSTNGASQHYDREFYDAIFKEGINEIGRAHQDSKEDSIGFFSPNNPMRFCYYQANLFGDPMATITIRLPHDLHVTLETPENPLIDNTYDIKATVTNKGENDENNIVFTLHLDDTEVASIIIPFLQADESYTLNFKWTPIVYDTFNFTACAIPVPYETYVGNNIKTHFVSNIINYKSVWFDDFENGLSKWESITGLWHLTNDSVTWPPPWNPSHSPTHSIWFGNESTGNIVNSSGRFISGDLISKPIDLSSEEKAYLEFYHWMQVLPWIGRQVSNVYISVDNSNWNLEYKHSECIPTWEKVNLDISDYCGSNSVRLKFSFNGLTGNGNWRGWFVDDINITIPMSNHNKPTLSEDLVFPSWGDQTMHFNFSVNYIDSDNNAPLYINTVIDGISYKMEKQDPADEDYTDGVFYQLLTYLQPGDHNYFFESNDGFSCFTDARMLSVAEKDNENSPILTNGQVDPAEGFTATPFTFSVIYYDSDNNAPEYVLVTINTKTHSMKKQDPRDNNYMDGCKYIYTCKLDEIINTYSFDCSDGIYVFNIGPYIGPVVERGQLFNGMYIQHYVKIGEASGYSKFSYAHHSNEIFNVSWANVRGFGSWSVNITTRIMSYPRMFTTFGSGQHTLAWISNNVSLGDNISIVVAGDFDHNFTISGEKIHYIPGFGAVEVWILEDQAYSNNIAWYEKSTGILLNGSFTSSYGFSIKFEFVDTNAKFTYLNLPPLNPLIMINNGELITLDSLVNLTLSVDSATEMCFRNGTTGDWTAWEPYSTKKQLYLEGSEDSRVYSIYVKFRNATGETVPIGDNILYLEEFPDLSGYQLYLYYFILSIILSYLLNG
ncbi:MAG: C25 family cysteine peptidase [Promethearchaeota archaeon]